jgi:hypothetical protein
MVQNVKYFPVYNCFIPPPGDIFMQLFHFVHETIFESAGSVFLLKHDTTGPIGGIVFLCA